MKNLALLVSTAAIAFMSEVCEVVLVSGKNGPVRVNKDDFDADQEKPTGDRQFKPYSGKEEPEQSSQSTSRTYDELGVEPRATPSAPDFTQGETVSNQPIDPAKNAVAPSITNATDRLAMKDGNKWYVVDGMGNKLDETGYPNKAAVDEAIRAL